MNWNELHIQPRYQLVYPSEHIVRFVSAYFTKDKILRKNIKIADIGCGCGRHTVLLAKEGFDTYASDISIEGIKSTKKSLHTNKVKAILHNENTCELSFPSNFFDAVISWGSIYYSDTKSYVQSLNEIHKILKPNGLLICMVRTTDDYRFGKGTKTEIGTYLLNVNETGENGMTVHFIDRNEIDSLFYRFNIVSIEKTETTFSNMQKKNSDWIITCRKQ